MKPQFFGPLDTRAVPPGRNILLAPLNYWTDLAGGVYLRVNKGFDTDFASIPRLLRWLISINGKHRKAAVLHDKLYSLAGSTGLPRDVCDAIFNEAMKVLGVSRWNRSMMYAVVRSGGWIAWRAHSKRLDSA